MQEYEEYKNANFDTIINHLGTETDYLLNHKCEKILKDDIHLPGPDFIDRVFINSDRSNQVLRNLKSIFNNGRLYAEHDRDPDN